MKYIIITISIVNEETSEDLLHYFDKFIEFNCYNPNHLIFTENDLIQEYL